MLQLYTNCQTVVKIYRLREPVSPKAFVWRSDGLVVSTNHSVDWSIKTSSVKRKDQTRIVREAERTPVSNGTRYIRSPNKIYARLRSVLCCSHFRILKVSKKKQKLSFCNFFPFCLLWVSSRNRCVIGCWIGSSDINLVPSKMSVFVSICKLFANKIIRRDVVPSGHSWLLTNIKSQ